VLAWQEQHRATAVTALDLATVRQATQHAISALQHFEAVLATTPLPESSRPPRNQGRSRRVVAARPEARP